MSKIFITILSLAALILAVHAQGTKADYDRAARLRTTSQNKVFRARVQPNWFDNGAKFWYRNDLPGGAREFVMVDAAKGTRLPAFDHKKLAKTLSEHGGSFDPDRLPVEWMESRNDGLYLRVAGVTWQYADGKLTKRADVTLSAPSLPRLRRPRPSGQGGEQSTITFANNTKNDVKLFWINGDNQRVAYGTIKPGEQFSQNTYAHHVFLVEDASGQFIGAYEATDTPGTAVIDERKDSPESGPEPRPDTHISPNAKWRAFIRDRNLILRDMTSGEESPLTVDGTADNSFTDPVLWSPDSRHVAVMKTKAGEGHKVYMVESSPADQVQPKLHTMDYYKPGDRLPISKPHIFDVAGSKEVLVSDALFQNPYDIDNPHWDAASGKFLFVYNQRGHQILRVIGIEPSSGEATAIVDETSKTFIDYADKFFMQQVGSDLIWMSERDGWNHLYLYDMDTGQVKNQITKGEWVVRQVDSVDEEHKVIWFRASGIIPGQDPYYIHYCKVNFDGTGLTVLTHGDGTHQVAFSPDRRFIVDTYSRVDLPPVSELRSAEDGKLVCKLELSNGSALIATGWKMPERFVSKGRDEKTDIYGVIIRPSNFDSNKNYPVIENIYAGPQGSFVPKSWAGYNQMMEMAELGFIVVQIDGMGTNNRSKAFHNVCYKNLIDGGFPDRILWIKAAAEKYHYMDLTRVGIYGGSAGGQNALAGLLTHGDFYKVGVADSGCHDNRMDKVWWNELWMGWPVGPEYAENSNVTHAKDLQGKLLLVAGELDTNVDPATTMQVVNALVKANKDFDLLIVPGAGHGAAETPYGSRRRKDFFVRNLLGVEPRAQ